MGLEVHSCELLEEGSRLFGPESKAFPDPEQRARARELAKTQGALLEEKWPLGYRSLELGVVFERGCPNNTVPILWAESSNPKWMPLFKRASTERTGSLAHRATAEPRVHHRTGGARQSAQRAM